MRASHPLLAIAVVSTALALGACNRVATGGSGEKVAIPAADAPPAGPSMAAGLWRQRVSGAHGAQVTTYCLDAGAAGGLASFNQQLSGHCTERQMALSDDGAWHFKTSCDAGAWGKVATQGVMRGDFTRHYTVDAEQQVAGGAASPGGAHVMVDVKRLGDCPKDMKPGDVVLPGGGRGRLGDLPANA
jgi:hypothetical protein